MTKQRRDRKLEPASTPNRLPSAVLCALVIPLALLGGGEILARTGRSAPMGKRPARRHTLISRPMAMGVYVGETLPNLLYTLGPPDDAAGLPTDIGPSRHADGRIALFYRTTDGGAAVVRLHHGRVVMMRVTDWGGKTLAQSLDPAEFSPPKPGAKQDGLRIAGT